MWTDGQMCMQTHFPCNLTVVENLAASDSNNEVKPESLPIDTTESVAHPGSAMVVENVEASDINIQESAPKSLPTESSPSNDGEKHDAP